MPVVILCGGLGIRMGDDRPKVLVRVGGRPILWHVMKIYAAQGFADFILALGYRGQEIKRYFLDYDAMSRDFTLGLDGEPSITYHTPSPEAGWRITFVDTGVHTQTGSRIRKVAHHIEEDTFFATYGDGVANIDLDGLLAFHRRMGRIATVTGVSSFSRFGVLRTDNQGVVTEFEEKPLVEALINGGFFVFEREVFDYLGDDDDVILEREPLQRLTADGQLVVYKHMGFWRAMDTFKDAKQMDTLWRQSAPWKTWD
ncbi:MAG: sugar phosphate nucleotidyltransferase [Anaerolineae bacterium]